MFFIKHQESAIPTRLQHGDVITLNTRTRRIQIMRGADPIFYKTQTPDGDIMMKGMEAMFMAEYVTMLAASAGLKPIDKGSIVRHEKVFELTAIPVDD